MSCVSQNYVAKHGRVVWLASQALLTVSILSPTPDERMKITIQKSLEDDFMKIIQSEEDLWTKGLRYSKT